MRGAASRSGRETISTARQAGCAWLAVLIAATFEICEASRRRVQSSKVRRKPRALCGVAAGRTASAGLPHHAPKQHLAGPEQVRTFHAVVFVELCSPTRLCISRDAAWAKYAQTSSRLIHIAKTGLLRSGFFVELRGATRRDISRDAAKAKSAFASSRLISTAKSAPLRSGFFVELRKATRVQLATPPYSRQSAPQARGLG